MMFFKNYYTELMILPFMVCVTFIYNIVSQNFQFPFRIQEITHFVGWLID